jgi:hypothetical protein
MVVLKLGTASMRNACYKNDEGLPALLSIEAGVGEPIPMIQALFSTTITVTIAARDCGTLSK